VVGFQEIFADVEQEIQGDRGDDEEREGRGGGEGYRCRHPAAERAEDTEEVEVVMVQYCFSLRCTVFMMFSFYGFPPLCLRFVLPTPTNPPVGCSIT